MDPCYTSTCLCTCPFCDSLTLSWLIVLSVQNFVFFWLHCKSFPSGCNSRSSVFKKTGSFWANPVDSRLTSIGWVRMSALILGAMFSFLSDSERDNKISRNVHFARSMCYTKNKMSNDVIYVPWRLWIYFGSEKLCYRSTVCQNDNWLWCSPK